LAIKILIQAIKILRIKNSTVVGTLPVAMGLFLAVRELLLVTRKLYLVIRKLFSFL
jgi:hypothetical protein